MSFVFLSFKVYPVFYKKSQTWKIFRIYLNEITIFQLLLTRFGLYYLLKDAKILIFGSSLKEQFFFPFNIEHIYERPIH